MNVEKRCNIHLLHFLKVEAGSCQQVVGGGGGRFAGQQMLGGELARLFTRRGKSPGRRGRRR